jgi:opacity protein-like surface antigen
MKNILIIFVILILPFMAQGQEVELSDTSQTKREKRRARLKPLKEGDLTVHIGLSSVGNDEIGFYYVGAEYMFNKKVGMRGAYSATKFPLKRNAWSSHNVGVDLTYHFIQYKRWDLYALAGIGIRHTSRRSASYVGEELQNTKFSPNVGLGFRYKITPSFSAQLEIARVFNIGFAKKISLKRKKNQTNKIR